MKRARQAWTLPTPVMVWIMSPSKSMLNFYLPGLWDFPDSSAGQESTCNAGDPSSVPGSGRSPGEGKGYPLQYAGLENSMDCIVHGFTKSQTRLRLWGTPTSSLHLQHCTASMSFWGEVKWAFIVTDRSTGGQVTLSWSQSEINGATKDFSPLFSDY